MMPKPSRRIAVTGIGVSTSIGETLPEFGSSLFNGKCGIGEISLFDTTGFSCHLGAQIKGEKLSTHFSSRETKRVSRCDLLGLVAAKEALTHSRLDFSRCNGEGVGVILGGGAGGMLSWEKFRRARWQGKPRPNPSLILASSPCTLTDLIANRYGLTGVRATITTACSSSANAIGYACDLIRSGDTQVAVTGGSESLSELTFTGFHALKVMSPEVCRPFDRERKGLSLGEGAAILVLENLERAEQRGATIHAEILGYALNSDAYHMTAPDPEARGMYRVMAQALKRAGIDADQVDYINAHGTATKANDRAESLAIRNLFGERCRESVSVSSTKSMVGHCLGASGGIEAVATILALYHQRVPPTANLKTPDPHCSLNHVMGVSRKQSIRTALSNSFAFGGNNTTLVFKHYG